MLGSLDDGEKLRELIPLPTLPRVAVQGDFLLETQQTRATSGNGAAGEERADAAAVLVLVSLGQGRPQDLNLACLFLVLRLTKTRRNSIQAPAVYFTA